MRKHRKRRKRTGTNGNRRGHGDSRAASSKSRRRVVIYCREKASRKLGCLSFLTRSKSREGSAPPGGTARTTRTRLRV